jgi:AraC-like DNA-binding protein
MSELLARWLSELRIRHTFLVIGRLGGAAAVRIEPEGVAAFHYCQRGPCTIAPVGHAQIQLGDGDFVFMRDGLARVAWGGDAARRDRPVALRSLVSAVPRDGAVAFSLGAADRVLLGGAFCIDSPEARMFVAALPPVFCVRRGAAHTARLSAIFDELVDEATAANPGAGPIVARLAEVAVLIAVRSFVTTDGHASSLVDAARDPRLGRALATIHREPARRWTVARLGRVAGMSRSGFAAAFTERVGEAPAAYLARVRMAQAERMLLERARPLPQIAEAVGYASAAAFSVAFKRLRGVSPSEIGGATRAARGAARRKLAARSDDQS